MNPDCGDVITDREDFLHLVMPLFNGAATVGRSISSLGCIGISNRSRVKLLVVDDGSTDGGAEVVKNSAGQIPGIEVCVVRQANRGSAGARNSALKGIHSGWVLFLDADDELIYDPVPLLEETHGASAILCSVKFVRKDKKGRMLRPVTPVGRKIPELFSRGNPYTVSSVIFRRENLSRLYDEELRYLEDWHFWAMNPGIFGRVQMRSDVVLARIWAGEANKSADQYKNGHYRHVVAERLREAYCDAGPLVANNLRLQEAIAAVQMGDRRLGFVWPKVPVSLGLFVKWLVYAFCFSLYRRFQPYRG